MTTEQLSEAMEYHRQGDLDEAARRYEEILSDEPNHPDALHLLGVIAHQRGDQELAARLVGHALEQAPDRGAFHCSMGNVHRVQGEFDEARACYEKSVELNPNLSEGYSNLGALLMAGGDLEGAERNLKLALVVDENNAQALNNMGTVLLRQGRSEEALPHLVKAARAAPRSAVAQANLGSALRARGTPGLAIQCFENAIDIRPDFERAHTELGEVLIELNQPDQAREAFRKALTLRPESSEAHRGMARLLRREGHAAEAVAHLEQALRDATDDPLLLTDLTDSYLAAGRFRPAADTARAWLQRDPKAWRAQLALGRALAGLGDLAGARQAFHRAAELRPDDARIQVQLAESLEAAGQLAESEQAADRALKLSPEEPFASAVKARNALRAGRAAKARERLEKALGAEPSPEAAVMLEDALALALEAEGDADGAVQASTRAHRTRAELPGFVRPLAPEPAALRRHAEGVDASTLAGWPTEPPDDNRPSPVLLFGLPGSGVVSLAEHLASHPGLAVLMDRFHVGFDRPDLFTEAHRFDALGSLEEGQLRVARRHYWQGVKRTFGEVGERRVVDALPPEHSLLEVAYRYLPDARFVWLVRDPRDALIDCCIGPHAGALATRHYLDPEATADYLDALARLFHAYREALPPGVVVLHHEDLVEDFDGALGRCLGELGVDTDDAVARNLARAQAAALPPRPFSEAGVERWRAFGDSLGKALQSLEEAAGLLGYQGAEVESG